MVSILIGLACLAIIVTFWEQLLVGILLLIAAAVALVGVLIAFGFLSAWSSLKDDRPHDTASAAEAARGYDVLAKLDPKTSGELEASSGTFALSPPLLKGLAYAEGRGLLIKNGWAPEPSVESAARGAETQSKWRSGYTEVVSCSGTADCLYRYRGPNGVGLSVVTDDGVISDAGFNDGARVPKKPKAAMVKKPESQRRGTEPAVELSPPVQPLALTPVPGPRRPTLSKRPSVGRGFKEPEYPAASRRASEEGEARVSVCVDTEGRMSNVKIVKSSGFERLDDQAIKALTNNRLDPAIGSDGKPIAMCDPYPYEFTYVWTLKKG